MKIEDNPHLIKTNVISRFSVYTIENYSVVNLSNGDKVKFIAGGFNISIEGSNVEDGVLICMSECFGRDGLSFIETDTNKILNRIEDVLQNGL